MELTSIKIEGFKKISDVQIELADLNILVGANGSGKEREPTAHASSVT